ncbi:TonB-dependent receptor [Desulfosarcina variabilis]|uniref:TonB-dependent receptor n=1 Tax=Desulfosarcina variabilis TaxID=2300 RepID=UPI003AFB406E
MMKKNGKVCALFILFVMQVFDDSMASAQDTIEPKASGAVQLESVTVTAQKREENPQEIPISMDVFSDFELEDATIRNAVDLVKFSPNVFMKQSHVEHALVIRGISSFTSSTYSPAGFYVDDVSYPIHYMQNVALFDLERIEILKGPQGTLYGKNSESGVVNIVTKQPGDEFEAKVSGEYVSYNSFRSGASIKGPIAPEKLYLGVAVQYDVSDGYTENISNGDDTVMDWEHLNGRATLRWTPSIPWDVGFIADTQHYDDHGGGYQFLSGPNATDSFEVRKDTEEYIEQDGNSQTLRIKYDTDAFDVLSISSALYQALDKQNDSDLWDSPANRRENIFKIRERQYSQELRIASARRGSFEWLAGVYGFIEDTTFDYQYDIVSSAMTYMHPITDIEASGYAAFGQGTYTLFRKLHLTAGLRFDHQEMEGEQKDDPRDVTCNGEMTYDELLPKFAVNHDISKDVMGYLSASKGYLVGGFNWLNATQETFQYDPEYTWNYEAGVKATWGAGRLITNISVFYIDIEDKQVTEYDYDTLTTTITNAAKARSQGVELQLQAIPLSGLEFFAGFGYTESKFDDFNSTQWNEDGSALIEKDYSDNDLPYAPRYTFNLGAQYRHPSGLFGRVDYLGTDHFYGDSANTARQDAYETLNLKLGYEQNRFDVYVWVKNALDEEYLSYVAPYGAYTIGLDGEPRIFGVTVNVRF